MPTHITLLHLLTVAALAVKDVDALRALRQPQLRTTGSGWGPCDPGVKQWSGYFDIPGKKADKHYFYWAFGPRDANPQAPVLLWMTGGPGCSSSLALLAENGPCLVNETTGNIYRNQYSWNNHAYVIYIDQPAGVGFSYADKDDYDKNEAEVSEDMYNFVKAFLGKHTELRNNDFFVVGESYGGHFAPATAYRINKGNRNGEGLKVRLAGLAVGNGFTDPYTQTASYPRLAWNWCQKALGKPCVSEEAHKLMKKTTALCRDFIRICNSKAPDADSFCRMAGGEFDNTMSLFGLTELNLYDIRKKCDQDGCYNFKGLNDFMNRADVQKSLGVKPTVWTGCNMEIYSMFAVDIYKNFNYTVSGLLDDGIRVMIYAGDMDFICNWIGNKEWTLALQWSGSKAFANATDKQFSTAAGTAAGRVRSVASDTSPIHFSFVQVYGAGHMVPMDQPAAASTIIEAFMKNKPLQ